MNRQVRIVESEPDDCRWCVFVTVQRDVLCYRSVMFPDESMMTPHPESL